MDILFFNTGWMLYNVSLALIAVIFGILTYKTRSLFIKIFFGIIWILFLPNTIYILTDIEHLFEDIGKTSGLIQVFLIFQYLLLMAGGIITFLYGLYPFEKMLNLSKKLKHNTKILIIIMNFLIAFGVVLGRVQRANSWDLLFDTQKVISDSLHVIYSKQLLFFFLFFAALCNIIYFYFRNYVKKCWRIIK